MKQLAPPELASLNLATSSSHWPHQESANRRQFGPHQKPRPPRALRSVNRSWPATNNNVADDCTIPCACVLILVGSARMTPSVISVGSSRPPGESILSVTSDTAASTRFASCRRGVRIEGWSGRSTGNKTWFCQSHWEVQVVAAECNWRCHGHSGWWYSRCGHLRNDRSVLGSRRGRHRGTFEKQQRATAIGMECHF
jgi:hypothetical protein